MADAHPFSRELKKLVHEWHVKGAILLSLFLQVLLLFLASIRKRTSNSLVQFLVYTVYKLSSLVASAAFALIVGARWFSPAQMPFGLWAAFMLLHLAGQDCLTAYSLEDFDAWLTSFLSVLWQYLFNFLIGTSQGDHLPLMTAVIFSIALIRLLAWTLRLLLGTQEMTGKRNLLDPCPLVLEDGQLGSLSSSADRLQSVLDARWLLRSSLQLIASIKDRSGSHSPDFFQSVRRHFEEIDDLKHAIRVAEVELNFIYDSYYTDGIIRKYMDDKCTLIYTSLGSYASLCCVITLITFISSCTGENYSKADYDVTCILLWLTLILEALSYLMMVFSDWTTASLAKYGGRALLLVTPHKWRWWSDHNGSTALALVRHRARIMFRRWSETISRFNFLAYSIKQPEEKPVNYVRPDVLTGLTELIRSFRFVSSDSYTDELGTFIFDELRKKPTDLISSLRRDWAIGDTYKRDVVAWHIATEVLYNSEQHPSRHCQYSKLLSDYMAYLLFTKPRFMSRIRGNPLAGIGAAQASVKSIVKRHSLEGGDFEVKLRRCCQGIIDLNPEGHYNEEEGILFNVNSMLTELRRMDADRCWTSLSETWVEILLYAASESDPLEHVRGLCQGGELVSLVWLLAFYLGLLSN